MPPPPSASQFCCPQPASGFGNHRHSVGYLSCFSAGYVSLSAISCNAFLSILCLNALGGLAGINVVLSVASINSVLSVASVNSVLSVGCYGEIGKVCW